MHDTASFENFSETVQIARDLIRIDTTNWGGGKAKPEAPAAEYVANFLRNLNLTPEFVESEPGRVSVLTRVRGLNPNLPAMVLHGHLDVVPADPANWTVDPFEGVIRDGLLWGRGAVDMKNMDAMIMTSIAELIRAGSAPNRDIILGFFADEEAGGVLGSHHVVTHRPELFDGATTAVSEVGGYSVHFGDTRAYLVQTGEKALDWIRLRARGLAQHGSSIPADNPLITLAEALVRLGRHEWPVALCDTTNDLLSRIAEIVGLDPATTSPRELVATAGLGSGFLKSSIQTTSNATVLQAGYKHNVIPDTAEALVDVRSLPQDQPDILAKIQEIVGPHIEIETVHSDVGLEVPFTGPLIDAMVSSLKQHDPEAKVLPYLLSGGTDNKALSRLGIKGYGFAPLKLPATLDFPGMFHGVDERVPLDSIDFGHRVLVDLLKSY